MQHAQRTVPVFFVLEAGDCRDMPARDDEDWLLIAAGDEMNVETLCGEVEVKNDGLHC